MAFADITEDNISDLMKHKDSKSTQRVVTRSVKLFRDFLVKKNESGDFENFSKQKLDDMLRLFYASIRKQDGDMMKKSSINLLKYGLAKHLKEKVQIDINGDPTFSSSKGVFSAVLTDMKKRGFGSVKHKPAICPEDLGKLYDPNCVALNPCTPQGLLNKCWFDVMTYLCRRGRENLREMTRDTFIINTDGSGRKFVMQVQDENNKNHTCTDGPDDTIGEGRMYERPGDQMCPVLSFEKYLLKMNPDNNAFWQLPCNSFNDADSVWYTRAPLGKNTLSNMMANISKLANISMIYTNHSIRATSITELDEAGVATRHIMRVSGHKSEISIKAYSRRLSDKKKREISDCLSKSLGNTTDTSVVSVQNGNQSLNEAMSINTASVPVSENLVSNSSANVIPGIDFLSNDIQALFDNDFELENIAPPVTVQNRDNSSMVPADTSINTVHNVNEYNYSAGPNVNSTMVPTSTSINTVRNVNEYNYSAGPNVLNTYQNNMATFPQNLMPHITNHNCSVNFHFYSK